jgi:hypothetical protein
MPPGRCAPHLVVDYSYLAIISRQAVGFFVEKNRDWKVAAIIQ